MAAAPIAEVGPQPTRFAGRRALVTGGGRGIGAAIARRLAAEGAEVVIASRTLRPAAALAAEIGAEAVEVDVGDVEAAQAAVAGAGDLDILVNNAGFDDSFDFFTDTAPERWRELMAVNLEGMFACAHAALPAMQAAAYGRVLNIGSEAGRIGSYGNAVYAATKGGVVAFTKSLARENARYGITVNALAVGPIETPLLQKVRATPDRGDRMVAAMERMTLMKRLGSAEEVAAAAAFLVSEEASYVTGETLGVSGGMGLGG
ncbi:MAG: SDR family NAD(P)-dependent oxidoreductase [Solirubrobacterales bacterium]